jgi:HTH-like domain
VLDIHRASNGTYGKRRITAELQLGYGMTVNQKAVRAAMRRLGIQGLPAPSTSDAGRRATGQPPVTWSPDSSRVRPLTSCG